MCQKKKASKAGWAKSSAGKDQPFLLALLAIEANCCRYLAQKNFAVCSQEKVLNAAHKWLFSLTRIRQVLFQGSSEMSNFPMQSRSCDELIFNLKIGPGHQTAQHQVNYALCMYASQNRNSIRPFSFDIHFPAPERGRCPDAAIYNFPCVNYARSSLPSVIFEIEFTHRSKCGTPILHEVFRTYSFPTSSNSSQVRSQEY